MSYRPITDFWILARSRTKGPNGGSFYGSYPYGFLERARALLGVNIQDPVLHVCGGMVKSYPYRGGFGPNDRALDADPRVSPDYLQDARSEYPIMDHVGSGGSSLWSAVLADPPYTEDDANKYPTGAQVLPSPKTILNNALRVVKLGGRVGILHYYTPNPPKGVKFVAAVAVFCGFNNRVRVYSVFERPAV